MPAVVVSLSVIVPRAAAFGFVLQLVFAVGVGFLGVCPRLVFGVCPLCWLLRCVPVPWHWAAGFVVEIDKLCCALAASRVSNGVSDGLRWADGQANLYKSFVNKSLMWRPSRHWWTSGKASMRRWLSHSLYRNVFQVQISDQIKAAGAVLRKLP